MQITKLNNNQTNIKSEYKITVNMYTNITYNVTYFNYHSALQCATVIYFDTMLISKTDKGIIELKPVFFPICFGSSLSLYTVTPTLVQHGHFTKKGA